MAQTATKKKAKTKTEAKRKTNALKHIAKSCVGRRITVTNVYATPSSWGGKIKKCKVVSGNTLRFDVRSDKEDSRSVVAHDVTTYIDADTVTIATQVASATIGPPAK